MTYGTQPAVGLWVHTLSGSSDFTGVTITENTGAPAVDGCTFAGSIIPTTTGVAGLNGQPGTWSVYSNTHWGYDGVGFTFSSFSYYQQQRLQRGLSLPCTVQVFQNLSAQFPNFTRTLYKSNVVLQSIISATGASSGREGQLQSRSLTTY